MSKLLLQSIEESKELLDHFKSENWKTYSILSDNIQATDLTKEQKKHILSSYQEANEKNFKAFNEGMKWLNACVEEIKNQIKK